jgi:hypothetical protein
VGGGPIATDPAFAFPGVNQPLQLYQGRLIVRLADREIKGNGQVQLTWRPDCALRFSMECEPNGSPFIGPAALVIPELRKDGIDVIVTNTKLSSKHPPVLEGVLTGRVSFGSEEPLSFVVFHLTNFHQFLGKPIGHQGEHSGTQWAGRALLETGEWTITVDAVPDIRERLDRVAREGGYAVTHVGVIRRIDNCPFSTTECDFILGVLQSFFSFVRGYWVAPFLLVGYAENCSRIWQDWTLRRFDEWRVVQSWFPTLISNALEDAFHAFWPFWSKHEHRALLDVSLYWYLASNRGGAVDQSIVTNMIGLESLANCVLPVTDFMFDVGATSAGEKLLRNLRLHEVPTAIPPDLGSLHDLGLFLQREEGPILLAMIRNLIVHPSLHNAPFREEILGRQGVTWHASLLGLWYYELLLLHAMGYRGRYDKRLSPHRWQGSSGFVPWIDKPESTSTS